MTGTCSPWQCPRCGGPLGSSDVDLSCSRCSSVFSIDDGVWAFAVRSNSHGELSADQARAFRSDIRRYGLDDSIEKLEVSSRDRIRRLILGAARGNVVELTDPARRERVLDFGCGYGGVSRSLARSFDQVFSLDGSYERVAISRAIADQEGLKNLVPIFHDDVLHLPFRDNTFDAVVLIGVFEYLPLALRDLSCLEAHLQSLAEFRRVLRPGGRLILGTHNRFGWQYLLGRRDHGGYPYRQILPRSVERVVAQVVGRDPCRLIYHRPGRMAALVRSQYSSCELFWAWPSYQFPETFVAIDGDRAQIRQLIETRYDGLKRTTLRVFDALNLLPQIIPTFYVVCRK